LARPIAHKGIQPLCIETPGVFLIGVTPDGMALLDHLLYLHGSWYDGPAAASRRAKVHVPKDLPFRTKPRIAADLVRNVAVLGIVTLDGITTDEEYGMNGELLDELERLGQRDVMEVPTTTVWTVDPAGCVPEYSGRGQPPKRPHEPTHGVGEPPSRLGVSSFPKSQPGGRSPEPSRWPSTA
jgi:hypothetical protein